MIIAADCVMLAAGSSERMEGWKMTLPFREATVLECSVRSALKACQRVILVTGFRAPELKARFRAWKRVKVVVNPDFGNGMFSSIKAGALRVLTPRFFLALGDMPLVDPEVYRLLWKERRVEVVIPQYRGKKGHPILLSRRVGQRILEAEEDVVLREILTAFPVLLLPVPGPGILQDLDTAEDYRRFVLDKEGDPGDSAWKGENN